VVYRRSFWPRLVMRPNCRYPLPELSHNAKEKVFLAADGALYIEENLFLQPFGAAIFELRRINQAG
jgi:hypothetical protein